VENSACTVVNSRPTRERLRAITNRIPIEVISPGCNPSESIPKTRGDYVVAITKWDRGKKPDFLLDVVEAARSVRHLKVIGFWVGKHVKESFLGEVSRRGLLDRVTVSDPIPEEKLKEIYTHARCLIHPTGEAYGMTALEAASCGCPFVIPLGSGVSDLFLEGVHGFFPREGDVEGFAKCLNWLSENDAAAWQMGYEGWTVSKFHTWNKHAEKLAEVINRVV